MHFLFIYILKYLLMFYCIKYGTLINTEKCFFATFEYKNLSLSNQTRCKNETSLTNFHSGGLLCL